MNRTITKCRRLSYTFYNDVGGYSSFICYAKRATPTFYSHVRTDGHNSGTPRKSIRLMPKGPNTMRYHSYSFMRQYVFSDLIRRIY